MSKMNMEEDLKLLLFSLAYNKIAPLNSCPFFVALLMFSSRNF